MHFLCPVCCSLNLQSFQVRDCALHVFFFQRVVSSPCCFSRQHPLWNSECKYWPWFGKWLPKDRDHAFPVLDLSSRNYWAAEGCRLHWVVVVMWVQNPAFSGGAHGKNNTRCRRGRASRAKSCCTRWLRPADSRWELLGSMASSHGDGFVMGNLS